MNEEKFVYRTKMKGPKMFSGRTTAKMHSLMASKSSVFHIIYNGGEVKAGRKGQQKQAKGKK